MQINIKNHLTCCPQHDSVYAPGNARKKKCDLSESSVKKAIDLLFGTVSAEHQEELIRIAKKDFFEHDSIVWYQSDYSLNEFNMFLKKNLLDSGRKEVKILEDGITIHYYKDISGRPEIINGWCLTPKTELTSSVFLCKKVKKVGKSIDK